MRYAPSYIRSGCGRSRRADLAEAEGKLPLTRATKALARAAGITQLDARERLLEDGACEYHHVGKFAREVDYYHWEVVLEEQFPAAAAELAAARAADRAERREPAAPPAPKPWDKVGVDAVPLARQALALYAQGATNSQVDRAIGFRGMTRMTARHIVGDVNDNREESR